MQQDNQTLAPAEPVLYVYRCGECGHRGQLHRPEVQPEQSARCEACGADVVAEWDGGVVLVPSSAAKSEPDRERLMEIDREVRARIGDLSRADNLELFYRRAGEVRGYVSALFVEEVVKDKALIDRWKAEIKDVEERRRKLLNEGMASEPSDQVLNVTEEAFDQAARKVLGALFDRYRERGYSRSNICDAIARKALIGSLPADPEAMAVIQDAAYGFWVGYRPSDDDAEFLCERIE